MWKLTLDRNVKDEYLKVMLPILVKRVKQWKGMGRKGRITTQQYTFMRKVLLPDWNDASPVKTDTLIKLLTEEPYKAYEINNDLMKKFVDGYCESELEKKKLLEKYRIKLRTLEKVFDYEGQISRSKSRSYWLAELIGHNTCTYCNRQYTFTVSGKNDEERITRPAFDHWFPKSLFPLLSLNIYNLIPSCSVCNSGAKGDKLFRLGEYVHPYLQVDDDPKFKFKPQIADKDKDTWNVVLERDVTANPEVDNTINAFGLDRIYDMHGNLEVKDLMDFSQAYSDTYLHDIFNKINDDLGFAGYSKEEIYRMFFGTEPEGSNYLNRPLSKLKRDILEYLYII